MKAGPIEIGRLLQSRARFCVPIYQRHYVWNRKKQWEPFWNDVRTKAIERIAGRDRRFSHFMGAVVLEARGGFSAGRVPSFQVVDGQQRLTTFQLFLAAARDYATSLGFAGTAERIAGYLINDKPHLMEDADVESYKVWPTQYDRELFIDIVRLGRVELRRKYAQHFYAYRDHIYDYNSVPALLGAYGYFFDRIRHSVETNDLDDEFTDGSPSPDEADIEALARRDLKLDQVWQALVEEFKVVEIVLEDGDDAQVIFETLNERGEPLLAADLVRNNIFQRADVAREKPEQLFRKYWTPFEETFWSVEDKQGRYKKPRIEFFLANFIAGQIAGEVNLSKLFSEYKAFLKRRQYLNTAAELEDLSRLGAVYRELVERSSDSALAQFSRRLQPWDVTTVYPLVMRIWDNAEVVAQDKDGCLVLLLSYIVRRAVCGLTTKNYNKFFLAAVAHLDAVGWGAKMLARFLLQQTSDTSRFPRDEEFEMHWLSSPAYQALQPARARAVLEEIEIAKRTRFHETNVLAAHLTVEHIMPQHWSSSWPLADGTVPSQEELSQSLFAVSEDASVVGQIVRRNRFKDTFGNLTLLTHPLNASVSNGPFADKVQAIREHSLLVLNREVTKNSEWNEQRIEERGAALYAAAKEIWPLPTFLEPEPNHNQFGSVS